MQPSLYIISCVSQCSTRNFNPSNRSIITIIRFNLFHISISNTPQTKTNKVLLLFCCWGFLGGGVGVVWGGNFNSHVRSPL